MKWLMLLLLAGCTTTEYVYVKVPVTIPDLAKPQYLTDEDMAKWTYEQVAKGYLIDLESCKAYSNQQQNILDSLRINQ